MERKKVLKKMVGPRDKTGYIEPEEEQTEEEIEILEAFSEADEYLYTEMGDVTWDFNFDTVE